MKFIKTLWLFVFYFVISSFCVFVVGLYETARVTGIEIVEDSLINSTVTPAEIYSYYVEYKSNYVFTNEPVILFMNFIMLFLLFHLCYHSWNTGRYSPPFALHSIFTNWSILMILGIYLFSIVIDHIKNIFVDQLIIVLFVEIYNGIYMYSFFVENYLYLILFCYVLSWFSNQLKYFDLLRRN